MVEPYFPRFDVTSRASDAVLDLRGDWCRWSDVRELLVMQAELAAENEILRASIRDLGETVVPRATCSPELTRMLRRSGSIASPRTTTRPHPDGDGDAC